MEATMGSFCLGEENHAKHAIRCLARHAGNEIGWTCCTLEWDF